jgi:hypothetical protein
MTVNPYQSGNEVVRAEFSPTSKEEVARLERSIAWVWGSLIVLWIVVFLSLAVLANILLAPNSPASSGSNLELLEVGMAQEVADHCRPPLANG